MKCNDMWQVKGATYGAALEIHFKNVDPIETKHQVDPSGSCPCVLEGGGSSASFLNPFPKQHGKSKEDSLSLTSNLVKKNMSSVLPVTCFLIQKYHRLRHERRVSQRRFSAACEHVQHDPV